MGFFSQIIADSRRSLTGSTVGIADPAAASVDTVASGRYGYDAVNESSMTDPVAVENVGVSNLSRDEKVSKNTGVQSIQYPIHSEHDSAYPSGEAPQHGPKPKKLDVINRDINSDFSSSSSVKISAPIGADNKTREVKASDPDGSVSVAYSAHKISEDVSALPLESAVDSIKLKNSAEPNRKTIFESSEEYPASKSLQNFSYDDSDSSDNVEKTYARSGSPSAMTDESPSIKNEVKKAIRGTILAEQAGADNAEFRQNIADKKSEKKSQPVQPQVRIGQVTVVVEGPVQKKSSQAVVRRYDTDSRLFLRGL